MTRKRRMFKDFSINYFNFYWDRVLVFGLLDYSYKYHIVNCIISEGLIFRGVNL